MINSERYFKQCLDFSGLKDGNKLATDIDCFIEIDDKLYIIIEIKHENSKEIPLGQRIALERLCKRLNTNTSKCFVLIGEHNVPNNQIINICQTKLISYNNGKQWVTPKNNTNILQAVNVLKKHFIF